MGRYAQIPTSLKVVAYLFILSGVAALIDIIVAASEGRLRFNLDVLGLFIAVGLLRLNLTWRTVALVWCVLGMIVAAIIGLALLLAGAEDLPDVSVFGRIVGGIQAAAGVVLAAAYFLISLWQYRVLTRPHVRALFVHQPTDG